MRLFQLVILFGQLFHIHLAVRELPGQLASGGVELYQFRFMLCLVLGSGLLKLDFLQAVIDRLQVLESSGAVIELLDFFHSCGLPVQRFLQALCGGAVFIDTAFQIFKVVNAVIRDIKKKITSLMGWIADMKAELAKPQAPDLVSLLNAYYTQRKAGAYSQKGKISNLKEMNDTFNYLRANGIYSLEDLERRVSEHSAATESLKKTLDEQTARMKAIKQLYDSSAAFQNLKPVYDGLQKIKLSSGGVELFQFRFMLCLVLGSGLLKLDFLKPS